MKSALMSLLAWLLLAAVAVYLLVGALLYLQQERLLFPAPRGEVAGLARQPGIEPLEIATGEDGVTLHGALRRADNAGPVRLIVYFGGNGELASAALPDPRWPPGWTVAAIEYRGYGRSGGRPSEQALFADALRVHDELVRRLGVAPHRFVAVGRSLGSGVAVWLASQREIAGVALVTPYDSITEVAAGIYPWLPVRYLIRHAFDSHRIAHDIRTPALFVTAGRDTLIRAHHSERLLQAWAGPKRHVDLAAADHDDVLDHDEWWHELRRFVAQLAGAARR
ncbi:alpha/beta hydrolase [Caldimonas tepidiphila]|uniref:alpha/beta hydrolase n=1 Tax=Caldimonas tepidiphila TaxID=2315841 RepID=UPI000E5AC4EA|nr:alpha/beta hydrolase [Caldimonas tepidiphila]